MRPDDEPTIEDLTRIDWPEIPGHQCECCGKPAQVKSFTHWDAQYVLREQDRPDYFCRPCYHEIECDNAELVEKEGAD